MLNIPYLHVREFQGEEGRRVIIAQEMLRSGDWIVPSVEGEVYLRKPPFYNWVLAGIFGVLGKASEMTARIPSVLFATLAALGLTLFWWRTSRERDLRFIVPGLIYLTFSDVIDKAVRAEIDMTFASLVTLALVSWFILHESYGRKTLAWVLSLFLVGISVLTKGVQAPAFFYCAVMPYLLVRKEVRNLFSWGHLAGIGIAVAVIAMWFVPVALAAGGGEVVKTWWHEIAVRGEPLSGSRFWNHIVDFPLSFVLAYLPWIPFLILWKDRSLRPEDEHLRKFALFALLPLVISIPVYWLIPGARLRYLMPLAGMLALLIAIPLDGLLERERAPSWVTWYFRVIGFTCALAVISAPFWGVRFSLASRPAALAIMVALLAVSIFLVRMKGRFAHALMLFLAVVLLGKLFWASLYFPYHAERHSYYRNAAREINALMPVDAPLYDYRVLNPHLTFYLDRPVLLIQSLNDPRIGPGAIVLIRKGAEQDQDMSRFTFLAEIEARSSTYQLYRFDMKQPDLEALGISEAFQHDVRQHETEAGTGRVGQCRG